MESQLGPLAYEHSKDNSAEFVYLEGEIPSPAGSGVGDVYEGPYYSFYPWPPEMEPGQYERSREEAYQLIYETIEEDGPFDGIIGFSQGATLTYSFLQHHAKTHPFDPPYSPFRCAVFICGLPPFRLDTRATMLFDDIQTKVSIPTVHIAGKSDDVFKHSLALYDMCKAETSTLLCHSQGHTVPWNRQITVAMANAIRKLDSQATMGG
ncbi:MAG: hypothetical protein Q9187_000552 [Circinaria calcarea]